MAEDDKNLTDDLKEFEENPYDHYDKRPEDVVRLFYVHDVPVIPVVSKRGVLIGVLRKESVISQLSDIERVEKLKIDEFITQLAGRMNFDDLLPYGKIREFVVINIFGELQGTWTRLQLFTACENNKGSGPVEEVKKQQEEQALEWMIYLILEHVPRGLYAINEHGRTIFYNSYFDDFFSAKFGKDVDIEFVEKSIVDPHKNELRPDPSGSNIIFYNSVMDLTYERIPLVSKGRKSGFLIFCDNMGADTPVPAEGGGPLSDRIETFERQVIVDAIQRASSLGEAASELGLNKQSLRSRLKKFGIETDKK